MADTAVCPRCAANIEPGGGRRCPSCGYEMPRSAGATPYRAINESVPDAHLQGGPAVPDQSLMMIIAAVIAVGVVVIALAMLFNR